MSEKFRKSKSFVSLLSQLKFEIQRLYEGEVGDVALEVDDLNEKTGTAIKYHD